jgi:hypothetical protein
MPALAKVKQLAARMVCGSHLSGIGKAMLVYANDHKQEYPRSGWASTTWNVYLAGPGSLGWRGKTREEAYGSPTGQTCATISSCFYLLIKYTDVTVKHFMCKGDYGVKPFEMHELVKVGLTDYTEAWDFGPTSTAAEGGRSPAIHNSYSYHLPFPARMRIGSGWREVSFAIQPSSDPSSPLCGDLNPYLDYGAKGNVALQDYGYLDNPDFGELAYWDIAEGYKDPDRTANAASHQREGQNVLYNDGHVRFESTPNVGIEHDNIWKHWLPGIVPNKQERELGNVGVNALGNPQNESTDYAPKSETDAFLVNEINNTKVSIK